MYPGNLSFVEPGLLAGCAHPRRWGGLEALEYLASHGIRALVSLDEMGVDPALLTDLPLDHLHEPIVDFSVPTPDQVARILGFIRKALDEGQPVAVHCAAGIGRTGTILACWFVREKGFSAQRAIDHVRRLRPGSIETVEQEDFIHDFAEDVGKDPA
jgi:atypical dual specificity phosphatase